MLRLHHWACYATDADDNLNLTQKYEILKSMILFWMMGCELLSLTCFFHY